MSDAREQFTIHEENNLFLFYMVVDFPFWPWAYKYFKSKVISLYSDK